MRRQLEDLHINQTKMKKAIKKNLNLLVARLNQNQNLDLKDSSDSKNSITSSENELETNTLACLWNESGSSFSDTSESSNSESDESETRGYASSEEYEVNTTKKKKLILIARDKRSTNVPSQKLLAKNLVPLLIKRAIKIDPKGHCFAILDHLKF
ncbi:hypothetical protein F8M41_018864 [Gigaspora margarita]|uniref:Uncharacterized protein n=1 Tax=Gigaspora margarita TaxID=4874 RepID=A0A8H4EKW6_GIGMA|nr:hypothetical protein F8M41_018864 [Gigaspora margarita]